MGRDVTDQFDQKICSDDDDGKCYELAGATDAQWYRSGGSSHLGVTMKKWFMTIARN